MPATKSAFWTSLRAMVAAVPARMDAVVSKEGKKRELRVTISPKAVNDRWSECSGYYAVWVDENWRLTFSFDGEDAELVDYQDYH